MPTTIDTKLYDDIISKRVLESFHSALSPLSMFSTDYSPEAREYGASIIVPLLGGVEATDTRNDYETATGKMAPVEISLDQYAKATVGLTDEQFLNSSSATLEGFADEMGQAVAEKVIKDVFKLITKTNFPAMLTATPGMPMTKLVKQARRIMNSKNVPLSRRTFFPSVDAFDLLADDPAVQFASALHYGGTEYIREGKIPRFLGFDIFESTLLPESAQNGFCVHPAALAVATRALISKSKESYLESRVITDKKTGMALYYRRHYSTSKGKMFITVECVYGATVGQKDGLVILPQIPAESPTK